MEIIFLNNIINKYIKNLNKILNMVNMKLELNFNKINLKNGEYYFINIIIIYIFLV